MADSPIPPLRILSLFSGIGGLDLGVYRAAPGSRVVCHVEREAFCASVLLARMEDEALEPAPVWCGNIEDFPAEQFAGRVDLITAGWPCPPVSVAGKRKGTADERWLWPQIVRVVRAVGPRFVFLENVRGLLSANDGGALAEVLGDLAELGFDAEWGVLRASDVGAPHQRARWFCLAHSQCASGRAKRAKRGGGLKRDDREGEKDCGAGITESLLADSGRQKPPCTRGDPRPAETINPVGFGSETLADKRSGGFAARIGPQGGEPISGDGLQDVANSKCARWAKAGTRAGQHPGSKSETRGRDFPPGPSDTAAWAEILRERPDLAPALSISEEDKLGLTHQFASRRGATSSASSQPTLRRVADGVSNWSHGGLSDEQMVSEEAGTADDPGSSVRTVWDTGRENRETSSEPRQTAGCDDSLPFVPQETGTRRRENASESREGVCDLRGKIHAEMQPQDQNMLKELLERAWATECGKTVARALSGESLCMVRQRIQAAALSGADVFKILRKQAGLVQATEFRTDRLRALGNAVVPAQAELAFRVLWGRHVAS